MSGGRGSWPVIRDLLLVVVVAATGLALGTVAAGLPGGITMVAQLDPLSERPPAATTGMQARSFASAAASAELVELSASTPDHPQPPVFPFSGQPQSGRQLDLRLELARMAAQQRHAFAAVAQP